jgi:hypothetical protein
VEEVGAEGVTVVVVLEEAEAAEVEVAVAVVAEEEEVHLVDNLPLHPQPQHQARLTTVEG